ncbi:nucleotide exchange factor GrpE [Candidatus Nitrosopelagicus sp.]|nr:nucleotide exchange factor GrpE [Candidatus Nitrosopelagicus sp.]
MSEDKKQINEERMKIEEMKESLDKSNKIMKENNDDVKKLIQEKHDLKDKWQRALADYQNLERRTQVEVSQRVSSKTNDLLLNFINIYEDFIRAVDVLSKDNVDTNGLQAIIKNMESLLHENNIEPIDAVGEIFDPQIHEAVSMIVDETLDEGTITQEVSKGYISGKAILKPSKVIVSKK